MGIGEKIYEDKFAIFALLYPNKVAAILKFDINLAKQIYGSADYFF